jgi:glutaredoxin
MAKQYLDDKKIVYTQIDVTSDPKAAQDLVKKTGQMGVPVIEIDDKIIVGFDQDQIDQALAKK